MFQKVKKTIWAEIAAIIKQECEKNTYIEATIGFNKLNIKHSDDVAIS